MMILSLQNRAMNPTKLFYEIQYYDISKEYPKEFVYTLAALVKDYIYYSYTFQAYINEISISKDLCKTNFTKIKKSTIDYVIY